MIKDHRWEGILIKIYSRQDSYQKLIAMFNIIPYYAHPFLNLNRYRLLAHFRLISLVNLGNLSRLNRKTECHQSSND